MSDLLKKPKISEPVECLGKTYPSDQARREHFRNLLAVKLKDPAFRKQVGFPIGTDDAILKIVDAGLELTTSAG